MKIISLLVSVVYLTFSYLSNAQGIVPPESGDLISTKVPIESVMYKAKKTEVTPFEQDGNHGITVSFQPGARYPGVTFVTPDKKGWNLTGYGMIMVEVFNSGQSTLDLCLRVDNPPVNATKEPWTTSKPVTIKAGESKALSVALERTKKTTGFVLDPSQIVAINLFATSPQEPGVFVVKSIRGAH